MTNYQLTNCDRDNAEELSRRSRRITQKKDKEQLKRNNWQWTIQSQKLKEKGIIKNNHHRGDGEHGEV
jgi:hypothetical protein